MSHYELAETVAPLEFLNLPKSPSRQGNVPPPHSRNFPNYKGASKTHSKSGSNVDAKPDETQKMRVDQQHHLEPPRIPVAGGWNQQMVAGSPTQSYEVCDQIAAYSPTADSRLDGSTLREFFYRTFAFVPGLWTDDEFYRTYESKFQAGVSTIQAGNSAKQEVVSQRPVQACWQVDAFHWPTITDRFLQDHSLLISQIGSTILEQMKGVGNRLAICGVGRFSGKSMLTVCLSRWMAKRMSRVLMVDSDIDSANLTLFAGVEQRISWLNSMIQQLPFREAMIESIHERLTLAAIRKPSQFEEAQQACRMLARLTETAARSFDFVLVDVGDASFLNQPVDTARPAVDGAVLIHHQRDVDKSQLELARLRLRNRGIKPVAIIKNFAS